MIDNYINLFLYTHFINLRLLFFIAHNIPTKAAPCEKPNIPSKGPCSKNVSSINARLVLNPIHVSLGTVALKTCSVLNHHPYPTLHTQEKLLIYWLGEMKSKNIYIYIIEHFLIFLWPTIFVCILLVTFIFQQNFMRRSYKYKIDLLFIFFPKRS